VVEGVVEGLVMMLPGDGTNAIVLMAVASSRQAIMVMVVVDLGIIMVTFNPRPFFERAPGARKALVSSFKRCTTLEENRGQSHRQK